MDRFRTALQHRLHDREDIDFSDVGVPEDTSSTAKQNTMIARAAREAVQEMLDNNPSNLPSGNSNASNSTAFYLNTLYNRNKNNDNVSVKSNINNNVQQEGETQEEKNNNVTKNDNVTTDAEKQEANNNNAENFAAFQRQLSLHRHRRKLMQTADNIVANSVDPLFRTIVEKTKGKRFNNAICVVVSASTFSRSVLSLHMERRGWTCICVSKTSSSSPLTTSSTSASTDQKKNNSDDQRKDNEKNDDGEEILRQSLKEIEKKFRYGQHGVKFAGKAKLGDAFDLNFTQEGENNNNNNNHNDEENRQKDSKTTATSLTFPKIRLVLIDSFTHESPQESAHNIRNLLVSLRIEAASDEIEAQRRKRQQLFYENLTYGIHNHSRGSSSDEQQSNLYFQHHREDPIEKEKREKMEAQFANDQKEEGLKEAQQIVVVQLTQIRSDGGRGLQLPNFVEPDPEGFERAIISQVTLNNNTGKNNNSNSKSSSTANISPTRRKKSSSFVNAQSQQQQQKQKQQQQQKQQDPNSLLLALLSKVDVIVRSAFTSTLAEKISSFFLTEAARSRSRIVNVTSVYDSIRGILGGVSSRRFDAGDEIIGEMYDCFSPSSDLIQEVFKLKKKQDEEIQKQQEKKSASSRRGSLMFSPNANEHALIPPLLLASNSQKPSAAFTTNFSFGSAPLSPPQQQQLDLETAAKNGKNNSTGNFSDSGSLLSLQTLQKNRTAVGNKNDPLTFLSFESDPRFVVLRAHYQHMRKLLERTNEEVKGKDRRIRKMQDEVGALADEVKNLSATQSGIGVAALLSIPRQTEDVAVSTADDEEAMGQGSWLQEKNRLLDRVTKSEAKAKRLQDQLQQGANARKQQQLLADGPDVVDMTNDNPNLLPSSSPQQNNNVSSAAVRSLRNKIQDFEEKLQDLQTERNLLKEVADTAQKQWFEMAGSASARMESSLRGSVVFAGAEAQRQAGRGALVIGGAAFSNVSSLVDQLKQQASKIKHASVWKKGLREMLRVAECSAMAALDVDANFQRSTFRRPTIVGDGGNRRNNNNNTNQNQRSNSFGIFSGSNNNNNNHSPENAKISSRASSFRHQQQQNKSRNNSRAKKSKNLVSWGRGEDGSMSDSLDENDEEEDDDDEQNNSSNFDSESENSEPFASSCPNDLLRKHKQNLRSKKSGDSHHKKKATSKKHSEHRVSRKSVSGDEKNQSQSNNNNNNANGGDYLLSTQDPLLNPDYMPPGVDEKLLNDTSYHYPKSDKKRVQKKKSAGVVEQNFADVSQRSSSSRRKSKKEKAIKHQQQELLSSSSNKDYYYRDRKKSSSYNPNIAAAATEVTSSNRGRSQFYYGPAEPPEEYDSSEDDYDGSSSSSSSCDDDTAASESKNNKKSRRQHHHKKKRTTHHNNSQRPHHHHQVHEAYQKLETLSKNLSEMFQHVVDYTEQAAEARRVGLDGLFEAVVRVASKATKLNDPNKVVRLRASVDEKQKSLDEILSRPLGADAGSMAALRNRGDEFFHHYLERYHLVAELRRLEESCNVQHSSRVKEHLLRSLLQAQNRMDEVGSYLLNNNELFMYAESRMEVFKLLQELAPWITSEEYDLLQREGKSAIAEMMAQCQIARTTTVDDDAVLAQQKMTVLEEEQKAAAATARSNPNKRRLSVSIAQFERTAKALAKNVTNNNNNGGSSSGRNVNEDQDQEEVPSQELASELDKEISRFVLDEGVDAIRDILKQLRGMWERDENISNNNNNLQSPPSSPLFSPKNKNFPISASPSSPVTLASPISGSLAGITTQNNSKSLHYIVNNWKRDATRMVLQTAEEIGRSIEEFKKREKQSQEFIDVTGFDIRPFNKMILQRLLHDPFAVSASAQQSASNNNNNASSVVAVPNSAIQNNGMNNNNNSVVVSAAAAAADPSATNVRIVSTVEAFREASLLLHDQLRRLLLQLKRRTPLTKIKIVDFAAELNLHKKKRLRQTSEFPGLMCVDAELVSRFADYFESETKGQYLIARSNFKVRAGEMMKSAHTQTTALQAIEEQAKSSLLLASANAYRRSNHNSENNSPNSPKKLNFDESVKRMDASGPQQVNLLQTLKEEDEKIAVAKSSATKHYFNNNNNQPHGNKSSEQQQQPQESQFGALSMNPNSPGHFAKMLPDGSISIQFMKNFGKQVKFSGKPSSPTSTTMLTLEYERATTPEEENNDKEKPKPKSSTVGVQVVTTAITDENNNNNNSEETNGQNESLPPLLSPHSPKPPSQPSSSATTTGNGFTRSSINQKILEKQIEEQKQASYFGPSRKKLLGQEQKEQEEKEMVLKQFVPLPAITKLTQQLFVGNEKNIMLNKKRVITSNSSARQIRQQEATISQTTRFERGREDEENKERHDEVDDDDDGDGNDDDDDQGKQVVVPTKNPQLNHQPEQTFAQIVRELPWNARVHSSQEQPRNSNIQHHSYDSKKRFLLATAETTYGSTSENGTSEKQNNSIPCLPNHQKGPKSSNNKNSKKLIPAVLVYPSRQMALAPTIKGSDGKELVSGGVGYNLVVVDDE